MCENCAKLQRKVDKLQNTTRLLSEVVKDTAPWLTPNYKCITTMQEEALQDTKPKPHAA